MTDPLSCISESGLHLDSCIRFESIRFAACPQHPTVSAAGMLRIHHYDYNLQAGHHAGCLKYQHSLSVLFESQSFYCTCFDKTTRVPLNLRQSGGKPSLFKIINGAEQAIAINEETRPTCQLLRNRPLIAPKQTLRPCIVMTRTPPGVNPSRTFHCLPWPGDRGSLIGLAASGH